MRAQDSEGHVVNTASLFGLVSVPWTGIYNVTKHAIVTLSETLHHELTLTGSKLKVSVLCPAGVNARLMDGDRNRPAELLNPAPQTSPQGEMIERAIREFLATGLAPEQVADYVFNAIRDEKFYILTHPEWKGAIRTRMENILEERNPTQPVS